MNTLYSLRSRLFDLISFGRSELTIFGIILGETVFLGATFLVAEPPYLLVSVEDGTALAITSVLTVLLVVGLYILLSGLGSQTYSLKFHSPVHILKCWAIYLALAVVVVYLGYLFFVYPYSGTVIPNSVDIGIGAVFSAAYAISMAGLINAEGYLSDNTISKSVSITKFLTAASDLRETQESEIVDEPEQMIEAGESIITGLQTSRLEGTEELAEDLAEWLETFEQRELRGQKKMVGDLPDSNTRFSIWEDRYSDFQDLQQKLEAMDNSAIGKVLLSIRGN
jgi:hypothetical protein